MRVTLYGMEDFTRFSHPLDQRSVLGSAPHHTCILSASPPVFNQGLPSRVLGVALSRPLAGSPDPRPLAGTPVCEATCRGPGQLCPACRSLCPQSTWSRLPLVCRSTSQCRGMNSLLSSPSHQRRVGSSSPAPHSPAALLPQAPRPLPLTVSCMYVHVYVCGGRMCMHTCVVGADSPACPS